MLKNLTDIKDGEVYKAKVCSRCGDYVLLKFLGVHEMDGGYTRYNKFEEAPEWQRVHGIGNLCPKCLEEYNAFIKGFMNLTIEEK